MKCLATIYRSKFDRDINLFMHHTDYLSRCGGTFIEKGRFKAFYQHEDFYEEMIVEQGTVMIPGYYKPRGSTDFIEMPEHHYLRSCKSGWNMTSLEPGSIIDCVFYPIGDKPYNNATMTTRVPGRGLRVWKELIVRVPQEDSLILSDAVWIHDEHVIDVSKDWYFVVVKGHVSINGIEKKKREWVVSSRKQELRIKNLSDKDSLVFLLQ